MFEFDDTILTIPDKTKYEIYDTDIAYGIKIYCEDKIYNLHYNKLAKNSRLIIHDDNKDDAFTWKDLPYSITTYSLLPDYIKVDKK